MPNLFLSSRRKYGKMNKERAIYWPTLNSVRHTTTSYRQQNGFRFNLVKVEYTPQPTPPFRDSLKDTFFTDNLIKKLSTTENEEIVGKICTYMLSSKPLAELFYLRKSNFTSLQ